jgi:hypothetical protein
VFFLTCVFLTCVFLTCVFLAYVYFFDLCIFLTCVFTLRATGKNSTTHVTAQAVVVVVVDVYSALFLNIIPEPMTSRKRHQRRVRQNVRNLLTKDIYFCRDDKLDRCKSLLQKFRSTTNPQTTHTLLNDILRRASTLGQVKIVQWVIEEGADDWDGGLEGACVAGDVGLAEDFIKRGAYTVNIGMCVAASEGHLQLVKLMAAHGANQWNNALRATCKKETSEELIAWLVEKGATDWDRAMSVCGTANTTAILYKYGAVPSIGVLMRLFNTYGSQRAEQIVRCEVKRFNDAITPSAVARQHDRLYAIFYSALACMWSDTYDVYSMLDLLYPYVQVRADREFKLREPGMYNERVIRWMVDLKYRQHGCIRSLPECITPRCGQSSSRRCILILLNAGVPWDVVRRCLCPRGKCPRGGSDTCDGRFEPILCDRRQQRRRVKNTLKQTLYSSLIEGCVMQYVPYC